MPRHTRARIDLDALRSNFRKARQLAPESASMAVVKADGYGHGLEPVARVLAGETDCLAVATVGEAQRLRDAGITTAIVLLEGVHEAADWPVVSALELQPVLHSYHQLAGAEALNGEVPVWIKCNTGMNRLGVAPQEVAAFRQRLETQPGLRVVGLLSHYACADDLSDPMTRRQQACFQRIRDDHPELQVSLANSAAHFHDPAPDCDWTRPGIMLYGGTPLIGTTGPALGLQPVMILESRIIAVRELAAGESVGYGATWVAEADCLMGIVEIGYGDGYPRHAPSGTPVAVAGHRCRLIGRVSMDMIAVDLSQCPEAETGTPVELWGHHVGVDEVAGMAGTISYELLTGVSPRVPRTYLGGG
ncbi:alanine racemase [Halovibrio salipaludis]|uniref:Alanine racemase n=1 Tax=Halovibrio salipaludis TaxID=2032626 RepID=A0A2A2F354_9GAMM|nr:alanine racemase [Halovibrio salipaludis]PAU79886.1 alanine racemase [Halovibrio salipaludis]